MLRAALFAAVAVGSLIVWLRSSEPMSEWPKVLTFSATLCGLAFALPTYARLVGGRTVFRVSLVSAAGALLGSVSNVMEDGLQLEWAFWLFILSLAIIDFGLFAFTIVVAFIGRGPRRLLAAVPAATLAGVLLFPVGGFVLMLAAWIAAAALALRWPAHSGAPADGRGPEDPPLEAAGTVS
ncbi:MAG: hypothetical protein M3R54_02655 [Chloroflexota bacterium]|nr:hypothetical protein [Chloroflexota bacterium]